tara:strand:+ start:171 stop:734 length:564 start_codon:yes stop_codon:yes gene_type:complete
MLLKFLSKAMSLRKILSIFLLSFYLIGNSNADFSDGLDAYNAGDYETAFQEWLSLAEEGDVRAQYNIGWMNTYGIGTLKDYEQAVNWYRKSANQGFVHAQFNLGNMYLRGDGVEKDDTLAFSWFFNAAEQGDAAAQYNLGRMYIMGKGVVANMAEARHWINRAYENNDKNISILAEEVWNKFKLGSY